MSVLIRGMDMPKRCYDCGLYKSLHMDSDGYGDNCDYCGALKRRFNQDKCDINPFKQKLSDCPLIEVADTPQTAQKIAEFQKMCGIGCSRCED